jgi:ankyrin repeat protein
LRTQKLSDLKKYLAKGGSANATIFLAAAAPGQWFADPSEYLGEGVLDPTALLALFCWKDARPHVDALLDAGADVNGCAIGVTPLMGAALGDKVDIIRLLLSLGAEVDMNNGRGTPLGAACDKGNLAAVKLLVTEGADINPPGSSRGKICLAPIMSAAVSGHIEVMQFLREKGAAFEAWSEDKRFSALQMTIELQGPAHSVQWLIDNGHDLHVSSEQGYMPLHSAAEVKHDAAMSLLIAARADVNATDNMGRGPLHVAASFNNTFAVAKLLQAGADPFALTQGVAQETPLRLAAAKNSVAAAELLLNSEVFRAHGNLTRAEEAVNKALIAAAHLGSAECLAVMLMHPLWREQPQEAREASEGTLLHWAKSVAVIDEIMKHATNPGLAVQLRTYGTGESCLHSAVRHGRPVQVICKLLKLDGVHPLFEDFSGQTAADLAREQGKTLMAQLLDRAAQDMQ